jgi:predicted nucleic acid-binding protein
LSFLLDTNVISELARARPNRQVTAWFNNIPNAALHLSVLSLGEIRKGVELLENSPRREQLRTWLEQDLPTWFEERLLPVSASVADLWGRILADAGRPLPAIDSLLAATAMHHNLRLVTRNTTGFRIAGLTVINPWTDTHTEETP